MDPRLLQAYNDELVYLREAAREFGDEHEVVAGRLGPKFPDEPDPYVERLLEGVAFLAARVHLKLDDQFPEFTQHLLQAVQPNYVAPTPAIAIAAFEPDHGDPALAAGLTLPRQARMSAPTPGHDTACQFRSTQDVTLWPLRVAEAEYLPTRAMVAGYQAGVDARAGVRIVFEATGEADLSSLTIDSLPIYLSGSEAVPGELYRHLLGEVAAVVGGPDAQHLTRLPKPEAYGFGDDCAVLPHDGRSFRGYRILSEYFACPERFLFVDLKGLRQAFAGCGRRCEIVVLFAREAAALRGLVNADTLRLFCSPVVNLFELQLANTPVVSTQHEHEVLPDRSRRLDYEVYRLLDVKALDRKGQSHPVAPLHAVGSQLYDWRDAVYYVTRLRTRRLSTREQRRRKRSDYVGSETWISLTAPNQTERLANITELSMRALVTNRELPELLRLGGKGDRLTLSDAAVKSAVLVRPPSRPRPPKGLSDAAWRVIAHLTPNYSSFTEGTPEEAANRLHNHLVLYGQDDDTAMKRQVDGIRRVSSSPTTRRLGGADRAAFARGLKMRITLDDAAFENGRMYLFASVLERFLSEFASINTFIETTFDSPELGDFAHWAPRLGLRPTI